MANAMGKYIEINITDYMWLCAEPWVEYTQLGNEDSLLIWFNDFFYFIAHKPGTHHHYFDANTLF